MSEEDWVLGWEWDARVGWDGMYSWGWGNTRWLLWGRVLADSALFTTATYMSNPSASPAAPPTHNGCHPACPRRPAPSRPHLFPPPPARSAWAHVDNTPSIALVWFSLGWNLQPSPSPPAAHTDLRCQRQFGQSWLDGQIGGQRRGERGERRDETGTLGDQEPVYV